MGNLQPDYDSPIKYRPEVEIDPVEEAASYVNRKWFQQMLPVRTTCYRCQQTSPIIFVPYSGVLCFGNPRLIREAKKRNKDDITRTVQDAFADVGWKFQLRRSYCPDCKGLGSA